MTYSRTNKPKNSNPKSASRSSKPSNRPAPFDKQERNTRNSKPVTRHPKSETWPASPEQKERSAKSAKSGARTPKAENRSATPEHKERSAQGAKSGARTPKSESRPALPEQKERSAKSTPSGARYPKSEPRPALPEPKGPPAAKPVASKLKAENWQASPAEIERITRNPKPASGNPKSENLQATVKSEPAIRKRGAQGAGQERRGKKQATKSENPAVRTKSLEQSGDQQPERFHPLLVRAVAQALHAIFYENKYADKVIEAALKQNPKAGSRDRAFIAETTYEVVRYYRLYCEMLGRTPVGEPEFWQIIGIHLAAHPRWAGAKLPDWPEFQILKQGEIAARIEQWSARQEHPQPEGILPRAIRESIPDWLDVLGQTDLSDRWTETLHWLNRPAQVVLRSNRLSTDRSALQQALREEGIDTQFVGTADALVLPRRQNIFQTRSFHKGWFEVQDYSSQLVAPLLAPEPGMRVVDACAGGGGKTLHLAALMQNRGRIIALDTVDWKLDELRIRARRAGASNIETRVIEGRKTIKRLYASADRLLLDVPCSGLGILRRNPDAKWKLSLQQIEHLRATQQDILQSYAPITKPGGRMVYATCSILPSENQEQVARFLESEAGRDFRLLEERRILPQDEGFDGFYMALLART